MQLRLRRLLLLRPTSVILVCFYQSHPRSIMSSLLHLITLMMTMMMMAATATPVDTGTNSPTVYVHLPSPPPVLILMHSVSFDSVSIVTGTPDDDYS